MDLIEENKKFEKNTTITNKKPSDKMRKILFEENSVKITKVYK